MNETDRINRIIELVVNVESCSKIKVSLSILMLCQLSIC